LLVAALLVAVAPMQTAAQPAPRAYSHLRLIAPAAPGGGWDQTARAMQQALLQAGLVRTSSVENIPGAAGTIALARFVSAEGGNGDVAMVSGLIMLAAVVTHRSPVTLREVTPIARLTGEYEVIVVPARSPFGSLADLLEAFKRNPESISWGGGSAGGTDQILAGLVADAAGVSPWRVNYIAFSGGGESMSAILGGQVSAGINGLAEFAPQIEAGTVRVLGISSAERLPSLDAPTLREQGIDVALENWRSIVAAPRIDAEQRSRLTAVVRDMVNSPAWREILTRYRWNDRYLDGEAFTAFTAAEEARVRAILAKLGTGTASSTAWGSIGVYPLLVLTAFAGIAVALGISAVKSGARKAEPSGAGWTPLLLIAAGIALDVVLLERAGFVIASSILFWLTARAFDAKHPVRDGVFAIVLSLAVYGLFVRLLQVPLPAGVLAGFF
jgi:putative tricarboxylic transport membrane protein